MITCLHTTPAQRHPLTFEEQLQLKQLPTVVSTHEATPLSTNPPTFLSDLQVVVILLMDHHHQQGTRGSERESLSTVTRFHPSG
jgi:hypothetical protein